MSILKLKQEHIEKYKRLYRRRFGVELEDKLAYQKASDLVELFRAVYRRMENHHGEERQRN